MEPNLKNPPQEPAARNKGKKGELAAWIERTAPREIGEPEWQILLDLLLVIHQRNIG